MPAVFYVFGLIFAAICANFSYGAAAHTEQVFTAVELANFQLGQVTALTAALGSGIISAICFATGAITQALLQRRDRE
jgi:hypothetical protein